MADLHGPEREYEQLNLLVEHLRQWCTIGSTRDGERYLLSFGVRIARTRLYRRLKCAAGAAGVQVDELATTALAELFTGSGPGSPLSLAMQKNWCGNAAIGARFNAVVCSRVRQFLYHQLEQNDPNGFKLTRNLDLAYERDPRFVVWDDRAFIGLLAVDALEEHKEPWSYEELLTLVMKVAKPYQHTRDWLAAVLAEVVGTPGKQRFVKVDLLEPAFREADARLFFDEVSRRSEQEAIDPELARKLRDAADSARREADQELQRLASNGRLDGETQLRFAKAINDLAGDFAQDGAPASSRYEYLLRHWPGLTRERYTESLKSPFQTVVEFVQQRLTQILRKNLE